MFGNEKTLYETDTEIEHYAIVERQYEGRPARVLFSGAHRAAQSGIGLDDDPDLLFDYNQRILELANGLYPKRVLVIGGGAFTLPMALSAGLPDAIVDVVELDPGLERIASGYFGLIVNDHLRLAFGDGRQFLAAATELYDLIVIDAFSELAIPRQFLTIEFVELLHSKLNPGGCIAMNIIATYQGRNAGLLRSQITAYSSVFAAFDIFPAAYGLTSWLPQNLVLTAQKAPSQKLAHFVRFAAIDQIEATADDIVHDDV